EAKSRFADAAQQLLPDAPVRPKPTAGLGRFSDPVPRHFTMLTYVTAGGTAVGLGFGIGFGLSARSKYKACETAVNSCSSDSRSSIRTTALIADIGWAIALGGTITTAVLYATSAESPHVIVEPGPSGATISAIGRF